MTGFAMAGVGRCLFLTPSPGSVAADGLSRPVASPLVSPATPRRRTKMPRPRLCSQPLDHDTLSIDMKTRIKEDQNLEIQGLKGRISKAIRNVKISTSPFDTAWVAMIPSPNSPSNPCFPECLEWILENQKPNGSWSLNGRHFYLIKDALLSTLACILALKLWKTGNDLIQHGLDFIQRNASYAIDETQYSPIGFNILFTRMIEYGTQLGICIPVGEHTLKIMLSMRDNELKSKNNSSQWEAYLAYIAEGVCPIEDYGQLKKYQKKNGSLFNSPSATAALLIHTQDEKAMDYMCSIVNKFGGAVPTVYPSDMYARLCIVDSLEKLGLSRYFIDYIKSVLTETYSMWSQNEEELFTDVSTCSLAFRMLRMHGYDISSDFFKHMDWEELLSYKWNSYPQNIATILELYKASQVQIRESEDSLEKLNYWSRKILEESLSDFVVRNDLEKFIIQEVDYNLKFPFLKNLERLEHKWNIENYNVNSVQCLKASFMFQNIDEMDILKVAMDDFKFCQSVYHEEFQLFQRWARETKLVQLVTVDMERIVYCYFSAAATIVRPELFDARMTWAKNSLLVTIVDDFFDVFGSEKEHDNLVDLCTRWSPNYKEDCCSTTVYILFEALYSTTIEISRKAYELQGYSITSHLTELWRDCLKTMNKEAKWKRVGALPTMEQYIANGYVSFGLGPIILPTTYFVGEKLSWEIIRSQEYHHLYKLVSTCGRLINDLQGVEREAKDNELNSISLQTRTGTMSEDDAKREIWKICDASRTKLFELVLRKNNSVVPKACKELFWNMCRICYFFYNKNDGYRKDDCVAAVKALIHEPITIKNLFPTGYFTY